MSWVARLRGCGVARQAKRSAAQPRNRATAKPLLALLLLLAFLAAPTASACPVCYGNPDSLMTKGSDNAMLFMLGIVGFVQLGFVGLFFTFWRRSRALRRRRESFRVIDGGVN
ncbi:MAG: hypothetical protein AABO58_09375 [Acidobacteriota bacterium]